MQTIQMNNAFKKISNNCSALGKHNKLIHQTIFNSFIILGDQLCYFVKSSLASANYIQFSTVEKNSIEVTFILYMILEIILCQV